MSALNFSAVQWDLVLWVFRTAGLVVAMLVLTLALRHWRRSQERYAERMFEQIDLLRADLLLLQDRFEQQAAVETRIVERTVQPEPRNASPVSVAPTPRGYEVAVRLARSGASVDELISSCGLSRNEAQLVLRLHGRQEAAPAAAARDNVRDSGREAPAKQASREPQREVTRRARLAVVG